MRLATLLVAATVTASILRPEALLAAGDAPLAVGAPAPPIGVLTNRGTFDSTASEKPIVLELFAVWCPHCQREVPVLNQLERADGSRVDIIAVPASPFSFDHTTLLDEKRLQTFISRFGVAYRVGFDEFYSLTYQYGVAQFPTFFFLSGARHVVAMEAGEVPFERLHADVGRLLASSH